MAGPVRPTQLSPGPVRRRACAPGDRQCCPGTRGRRGCSQWQRPSGRNSRRLRRDRGRGGGGGAHGDLGCTPNVGVRSWCSCWRHTSCRRRRRVARGAPGCTVPGWCVGPPSRLAPRRAPKQRRAPPSATPARAMAARRRGGRDLLGGWRRLGCLRVRALFVAGSRGGGAAGAACGLEATPSRHPLLPKPRGHLAAPTTAGVACPFAAAAAPATGPSHRPAAAASKVGATAACSAGGRGRHRQALTSPRSGARQRPRLLREGGGGSAPADGAMGGGALCGGACPKAPVATDATAATAAAVVPTVVAPRVWRLVGPAAAPAAPEPPCVEAASAVAATTTLDASSASAGPDTAAPDTTCTRRRRRPGVGRNQPG